ncbi:hypothetical protein [Terricaulis sp.]|uniref:hypothetical protein n=1 Tax=Terricaulis sp. TaxID=2768686 RepID=UPI003784DFBA
MKRGFAAMVWLVALMGAAFAQAPERLARPFPESRMGEDGRLVVASNMTLGNLAVDQFANYGRRIFAPEADREIVTRALTPMMCDTATAGGFARDQVAQLVRGMSRQERDRLKARDPASIEALAIAVAARLDGADAEAIRADEALGPGAYRDAINGFSVALDACRFFGLERRL